MLEPIPIETTATTADWVAAISAATTAVLTLVLVIAALWSLKAALKTLGASREANEQTERDSIERTRPYVFVEIVPGLAGIATYDLVIRNTGLSAARRVTLQFNPWPEAIDDIAEKVRTLMATPRDVPPGSSLRSVWHLGTAEGETFTDGTTEAGMPLAGSITVHYDSDEPKRDPYTETYPFDVNTAGLWPTPAAGPDAKGFENKRDRLFYKALQALTNQVGELRR